jgi:carbon starvation protein CstA
MLWAITVYLVRARGKQWYLITFLPACFMTAVVTTYIIIAKIGFNVPAALSPWLGLGVFLLSGGLFYLWYFLKQLNNK